MPENAADIDLYKAVEAIIFASDGPLKADQILELFEEEEFAVYGMTKEKLDDILAFIGEKYEADDFVFELRQIAGGYQFLTKMQYYGFARQAALNKSKKKLGRSSLETLSIIAYRQPVTKTELEFIRGVSCDYAIHKLLDKKLIEIQGRADAPGRPLLYGTSNYFMEYFGINDVSDLPKLEEINIDEAEFQANFKVYLEESEGEEENEDQDSPTNEETDGRSEEEESEA